MNWFLSWRTDVRAAQIADRHYNRQSPGSLHFVPPGRCVVLLTPAINALWVTSWQDPRFVKHAWPGAWVCTIFRNESPLLSSSLIVEAVAVTRWKFGKTPRRGMVTFIDKSKVRGKRHFGFCYLKAGFEPVGETGGGLLALHLPPARMPRPQPPAQPFGAQLLIEGVS